MQILWDGLTGSFALLMERDALVLSAAWRALRWRKKGTRIIPPGGASPEGAMGYLEAALERHQGQGGNVLSGARRHEEL